MFVILYFFVLILLYNLQKKICSQSTKLRIKVIIPVICFSLSITGTLYFVDTMYNNNRLIGYGNDRNNVITQTAETSDNTTYSVSDNSKPLATISISKNQLSVSDILTILMILNIPTAAFTFFIFSGRMFPVKKSV